MLPLRDIRGFLQTGASVPLFLLMLFFFYFSLENSKMLTNFSLFEFPEIYKAVPTIDCIAKIIMTNNAKS